MTGVTPKNILDFWFKEVPPEKKFNSDETLDKEIRDTFYTTWEAAINHELEHWKQTPEGWLALLLLFDQFTRNMFRGSEKAYSSDQLARKTAREAISNDIDLRFCPEQRIFFYLPFMHCETLANQDYCIELIKDRMGPEGENDLLHAKVHRIIIVEFGRFPFRNDALQRNSSNDEITWLRNVGYDKLVERTQNESS